MIKPFFDLLLRREMQGITIGKPNEFCVALPADFGSRTRLWFFERKADEFAAE
jgi:hypothetical protein